MLLSSQVDRAAVIVLYYTQISFSFKHLNIEIFFSVFLPNIIIKDDLLILIVQSVCNRVNNIIVNCIKC